MMIQSVVSRLYTIQELVAGLRTLPEAAFDSTEPIRAYLQAHPVDPVTLAPYLTWDAQHYTRNLIDRTPIYELMAICWSAGQASSVHNHKNQNCWMAVPVGRLKVQNYRVQMEDVASGLCSLEPTDLIEMNPGAPCAVNPEEPVHKVTNPREWSDPAVSLHIYSRPFDTCIVYSYELGTCGEINLRFNTEYGLPLKQPMVH